MSISDIHSPQQDTEQEKDRNKHCVYYMQGAILDT
jgi:hypothetical protein